MLSGESHISVYKNRIMELDFFKGLAILFVVCGHVIQFNGVGDPNGNPAYTWIYSFHMPLFFFISGYLISFTGRELSVESVAKKIKALLVPFCTWTFILFPLFSNHSLFFSFNEFFNPNSKFWFVYLLFLYSMIYYVSDYVYRNSRLGGAFVVIAFGGVFLFGEFFYHCSLFSRGIQFYPIYIYGVVAHKMSFASSKWIDNSLVQSLLLVFFVTTSLSYCRFDSSSINKMMKFVASASICTMVLSYMKLQLFQRYNGACLPIQNGIYLLGRNSIVIYLTHFLFVKIWIMPGVMERLTPVWNLVLSLLFSLFIAAVCLLIGKIVERHLWVNRFVYGRGWSYKKRFLDKDR